MRELGPADGTLVVKTFREGVAAIGGGVVTGELTMAGETRPVTVQRTPDGGRATLRQTDWGIKPYRGLMGALKVRDEVEVIVGGL